jgi:hypothetical protein
VRFHFHVYTEVRTVRCVGRDFLLTVVDPFSAYKGQLKVAVALQ